MIDHADLARTTFHIEAVMRAPNGALGTYSEAHRCGERQEDGGVIVSYSEEFAYNRAEAAAEEMGCELVEVECFHFTPRPYDFSTMDMARD